MTLLFKFFSLWKISQNIGCLLNHEQCSFADEEATKKSKQPDDDNEDSASARGKS